MPYDTVELTSAEIYRPPASAGLAGGPGELVTLLHDQKLSQRYLKPPLHGTIENGTVPGFATIDNCPSDAEYILEVQRSAYASGPSTISSLLVLMDKDARALKSVVFDWDRSPGAGHDQKPSGFHLQALDHQQAISDMRLHLLRPFSITDYQEYAGKYLTYFHQSENFPSPFRTATGLQVPEYMIPMELGLHMIKLYEKCDIQDQKFIEKLFREQPRTALHLLNAIETSSDLHELQNYHQTASPIERHQLYNSYTYFLRDIELLTESRQYPPERLELVREHLLGRASNLMRTVYRFRSESWFDSKWVDASFSALHDTVIGLYGADRPQQLAPEQAYYRDLIQFSVSQSNNTEALSLISSIIDEYLRRQLLGYQPGEYQDSARIFYTQLREDLYQFSSETTGDVTKQLVRLEQIMIWLSANKLWQPGEVLLDVGTGNGDFLRKFLATTIMQNQPPGQVYALDFMEYPQPADAAWTFIQGSFTDPHMIEQIPRKAHVITHIWSPIDDNPRVEHKLALDFISESLEPGGIAIIELPVGYEAEKLAYAQAHGQTTMTTIERSFPTRSVGQVGKRFDIASEYDLVQRAHQAGLKPVNFTSPGSGVPAELSPYYVTASGQDRMFLVLEKVGEPAPALDQILVGAWPPRQKPVSINS